MSDLLTSPIARVTRIRRWCLLFPYIYIYINYCMLFSPSRFLAGNAHSRVESFGAERTVMKRNTASLCRYRRLFILCQTSCGCCRTTFECIVLPPNTRKNVDVNTSIWVHFVFLFFSYYSLVRTKILGPHLW